MNPSLLGGAFAVLLVLFWWGNRSRTPLLRSHDASAVAALNRQQIERLRQQDSGTGPDPQAPGGVLDPLPSAVGFPEPPPQMPQRLRWRHQRLLQLAGQLRADPRGRRQALLEVQRWGDPAALPLLRRGLRDPDPEVVRLAAQGLERFRGRRWLSAQALAPSATAGAAARPRNVARTR